MNFRNARIVLLVWVGTVLMSWAQAKPEPCGGENDWLESTRYIDHENPLLRDIVSTVVGQKVETVDKAIALHDYVRDNIEFGFEAEFYALRASQVLRRGRGFCNNKSTLMVAMFRAADIPARHRFYALDSRVLKGLLDPGTRYVDHSIVEVHINGNWIPIDSFIVDTALFEGAQPKLQGALGLGMRKDAKLKWDGQNACFSQYHPDYVKQDFGVYRDVGDFYRRAQGSNNKLNALQRMFFRFGKNGVNRTIESLRS